MTEAQLDLVRRLAAQLRVDSIRCSTQVGSGHPTSSLSAADLANPSVPPLQVAHLAVQGLPTSGTTTELLDVAGISSRHIVDAAHRLVGA
ncbi:MAG: hypothetical protein ACRDRO_14765 [Pseudonocardiaceae bacterium]